MALFKYFTPQEKPTDSALYLEVEEANKTVYDRMYTLKSESRGKYNSYTLAVQPEGRNWKVHCGKWCNNYVSKCCEAFILSRNGVAIS